MQLTDAEYRHIMKNKGALESRIKNLTGEIKGLRAQGKTLIDQRDDSVEEMEFYDNFLSAAIKEYEDAHQPEEQ